MSIIALFIVVISFWHFVVPLFDKIPPINESTKTCLVTGASAGIGAEISREMVRRGWKVIGLARRQEKLDELAHELGPSFIPFVCDVSVQECVHQVSNQIKEQYLTPTLFFLIAGIHSREAPYEPLFNIHKQIFETNYFGVIAWVDEWLIPVKECGGGTFVATSSVRSFFGGPHVPSYGASKRALNSCFESLRLKYHRDNIGFVLVMPGPVDTTLHPNLKDFTFVHSPLYEAHYIIDHVFKREKQIEPSIFYSCLLKLLNWLPDELLFKMG